MFRSQTNSARKVSHISGILNKAFVLIVLDSRHAANNLNEVSPVYVILVAYLSNMSTRKKENG
jgi:hypothetical protein